MRKSMRWMVMLSVVGLFALGLSLPLTQVRGDAPQQATATVNATVDADATMAVTAEPTRAPVDLGNGLKIENDHSERHIDKPGLEIKIDKPLMSGATGDTIDNFNKAVDDIIKTTAQSFADDAVAAEATATLPPDVGGGESFVYVDYEVLNSSPTSDIVSIKFLVAWYSKGAAHPNSYTVPLNYDLKNAKALELADLFKPKSAYIKLLSTYSTATLKKAGKLEFPEGALPKEENFRSWNITPDGLQINFDDYQVTSHATGPQTVVVPYATLKTLIDPAGPLAAFIK